jgi:hypothetical protein
MQHKTHREMLHQSMLVGLIDVDALHEPPPAA